MGHSSWLEVSGRVLLLVKDGRFGQVFFKVRPWQKEDIFVFSLCEHGIECCNCKYWLVLALILMIIDPLKTLLVHSVFTDAIIHLSECIGIVTPSIAAYRIIFTLVAFCTVTYGVSLV